MHGLKDDIRNIKESLITATRNSIDNIDGTTLTRKQKCKKTKTNQNGCVDIWCDKQMTIHM